MPDLDMLDDVAAYLVLSPIAVLVLLALALIGWGLRGRLAPVTARLERRRSRPEVTL